ncbi:MAG: aminopeptidase P family protein [Spirochaetales bacterium]|nr:aminopeptidase P family protein [Spirochaetales bacterium]
MHTTDRRLKELRRIMRARNIHAYIVPSKDRHQNEYVPDMWKRREWLSGFTGSAGDVAVTLFKAGLWTDSRYFLQAEQELDGSGIVLFKSGNNDVPDMTAWLKDRLNQGDRLGIDPDLFSWEDVRAIKKKVDSKNIEVVCIEDNLVDLIRKDSPGFPDAPVTPYDTTFCGESFEDKIIRLKKQLDEEGCRFHVISSLDAIAWLFNIRGGDIPYNPCVIAYALIAKEEIKLFLRLQQTTEALSAHLRHLVSVYPYHEFLCHLVACAKKGGRAWIDGNRTSYRAVSLVEPHCELFFKESPVFYMKAVKNETEVASLKNAHLRDGIAMVKFLSWLEGAVREGGVTELSAERKLEAFRAEQQYYMGPSFRTISAFGEHGAIVHYAATAGTDTPIGGNGLYLVDSGAQYLDGTTDITRTVAIGTPTQEQKEMFTRVLKGNISLSMISFPRGTEGIQLDALARIFLWEKKLDYGHGTGHGVGFYLNVHEGPLSISQRRGTYVSLAPGMVCSIEPGYYKTGAYGIRIENLVVVAQNEDKPIHEHPFFHFKTLTLCPIDRSLIDPSLLTDKETAFIDVYHAAVRKTIGPCVEGEIKQWLFEATKPL